MKMKIEAQGRFLDKLMEEYKNRIPCTKPPIGPYSPILSLPSLSEESDQSNEKEFESDSEDVEIMSRDEFQTHKRIKIQDDVDVMLQTHTLPSFNPNPQNIGMLSIDGMNNNTNNNNNNNNLHADQEMEFPWSFCTLQSPLLPTIYHPLN